MVDEVIVNAIGLMFGLGTAQYLGDYAESKIKPGIVATSATQDKMIARVANNGPKIVLAYGAYMAGKSSPFAKSTAIGSIISVIFDNIWRYKHDGVPESGYTEIPIPVGTPTPTTPAPTTPAPTTPAPTTPAPTTPASTTPTASSTSSGQSPGEPDIGLLDSYFILDTDTLENIMEKGRILEEI